MLGAGNTAIEQKINHGTIRSDPRKKFLKPEEIEFNDSMIPILEKNKMEKEAKRICECGSKYNMFKCADNKNPCMRTMIFSYRCELKICPRCGRKQGIATRKNAQERIKRVNKTKTHKFAMVTLTQKKHKDGRITKDRIRKFNQNVKKLIKTLYPKKNNCGAMSVTEIGKGNNVHAHVLVYGPYISQEIISKIWKDITGDSYVVDIRAARDHKIALYYITKYIMKPPQYDDLEQYASYLKALKGVRRLHTYGIMYGVKIEKRKPLRCPLCESGIEYTGIVTAFYAGYFDDYFEVLKSNP